MANFTPVSAAVGGGLIGLASVLLMLLTGRIAGISGIFGGLLKAGSDDRGWRIAFIAGLILAPLAAGWIGYGMLPPQMPGWAVITAAGLLVGFGTRLGGRLHLRSQHLWGSAAIRPLRHSDRDLHARRDRDGRRHPSPVGRLNHADDRSPVLRIGVRRRPADFGNGPAGKSVGVSGYIRGLGPQPRRCDGRSTCRFDSRIHAGKAPCPASLRARNVFGRPIRGSIDRL
jgi:hypothetical protein